MTAPHAGAQRSPGRPRKSLIESEIERHTTRAEFEASMITTTHTPNGIVTHVVTAEAVPPVVQMESGRVVTKTVTGDFGTILAVLGGPAVVEVALHFTAAQRDAYAAAIQAVDQEAMSHVLVASRTAVLAILQQLGMTVEDDTPEDPAPAPDRQPPGELVTDAMDDGPTIWARLRHTHGPCTCASFVDDDDCTSHCDLCASLPESWPCPAWSGTGYGAGAVAGRP